MAREAKLQREVLKFLDTLGAYSFKVIAANKGGVHDITACISSRFVSIEVKSDIGAISALQFMRAQEIRDSGGIHLFVRPCSWPNVREVLRGIKKGDYP